MVPSINSDNMIYVDFFYSEKMSDPFAHASIPLDQLPEIFESDTQIALGSEMWQVLKAEPFKKEAFEKTGRLKLFISKPASMNINSGEIRFSFPTLSNEAPAFRKILPNDEIIIFREDDWRQFEFISIDHFYLIEEELSSISRIYEKEQDKEGFKNIHIRNKISDPLIRSKLTCGILKEYFKEENLYLSVGYQTQSHELIDGFSLKTASGWYLWGQINEDEFITVLNLSPSEKNDTHTFQREVMPFLQNEGLYLIDWPNRFWCGNGKSDFSAYGVDPLLKIQ